MFDTVTSLGLACNIAQLVDFGINCIKNVREIAESGSTEEQRRLRLITSDLSVVAHEITGQQNSEPLQNLAEQTEDVAQELSQLLDKLRVNDEDLQEPRLGKRKRSVAKSLVHSVWKRNDIKKLESRLSDLRQQMVLRLSAMQR